MEITTNIIDKKAFVTIKGSITVITAPDLDAEVKKIIKTINELEFDFKDVDYISSAGLRVLLSTQTSLEDTKIVIKNANDAIRDVFKITSFDSIFDIR